MTNSNFLMGMACPECGSEGPFRIAIEAMAVTNDDEYIRFDGVEWDEQSYISCEACKYDGSVRDFDIPEERK